VLRASSIQSNQRTTQQPAVPQCSDSTPPPTTAASAQPRAPPADTARAAELEVAYERGLAELARRSRDAVAEKRDALQQHVGLALRRAADAAAPP
jgi:hypothetical protein